MDTSEVGVIQRGQRLRFACEARQPIGVIGKRVRQTLEGNIAIESGVARPPYLPHPAFAEGRGDLVDAESGAGGEGQD